MPLAAGIGGMDVGVFVRRVGMCSWVGTMPPWWKIPMRTPRIALNPTQIARKVRVRGGRKQVRSSGMHGIRNRASW